jgi:integrase/recombinase XerD
MKLQEAIQHYLLTLETRRCSPYTLKSYRYILPLMADLLELLCGVVVLEQVTVLHLRQCLQYLLSTPAEKERHGNGRPPIGETLSISTIRVHVQRWKAFFNWCYKEELIDKNPVARLEAPRPDDREIPVFTEEHLQKMLEMFDLSTEMGFCDYVIILLLLDTGIRSSEIGSLRVEDVHDTYISVFGKGRKERQVGIHLELSNLIWRYIHKYRHPLDPNESALFLSTDNRHAGKPFGRGGIEGLIKRVKNVTGIDDVRLSPHTFRHTFAVMYLEEGGDVFSLSYDMGIVI